MTAFPAVALPSHSPEADRCSRVFLRTLPSGFFHKHSSASLPSYSPEADRCSRVFLQTMPSGFFHKHSSVNLPPHSPEADRCSRVFLRTILTGFFHKHSSGSRIAVTSLPRPPEIPCFFFPQSCRAFSMTAFPSGALPLHSPEADRCSRVFLRTLPSGFFHKHSSGSRIAVTSLPRPPEIPCFFFPQSCRAFSMTAFPAVALPSHAPEADRCSRVFLQTMPTGFFHKHSSGRRDAGEYKQLSAAEAYPRVQK